MACQWLLTTLIILALFEGSKSCFEEERLGLLEFKESAKSVSLDNDDDNVLPSWIDDDAESDCCKWERVVCNSMTRRVTHLYLNNTFRYDIYDISYVLVTDNIWYLNLSLFHHFMDLTTLDLSWNKIAAPLDNQEGFKRLASLKELKVLNVTSNKFNSSILPSLTALKSLQTLIIRDNEIKSDIPKEIGNLKYLETLDLSYNYFRGMLPLQELGKLTHLKVLLLHNNYLNGTLETQDFLLPASLEQLSLSFNEFNGSLTGLCGLQKLEQIFMSNSNLGGSLPACINNLTSLKYIDLSFNQFTGQISSSWLSSLTSLIYIDLSGNLFEGSLSFSVFANHSNLEFIQFISGSTQFNVVTDHDFYPSFQLQVLVLQNCNLHRIPHFLIHQTTLKMIDFSHNRIEGTFPIWLLQNNTDLEQLVFMNNSLTGELSFPIHSNVSWLDVSDNMFNGQLQDFGGLTFPDLKFLNLSRNDFQGDFHFLPEGECKLVGLDLSYNNFSGEIPGKMDSSCTLLSVLKLSHNNFHGKIFTTKFNLTGLFSLEMNDNRFVGTLPISPVNFEYLLMLDLSNNSLDGEIPSWIGNITNLGYLKLHDNFFQGPISCQLFAHGYVDLSYNHLSGSLPSCFEFNLQYSESFLTQDPLHINLQGNSLTGSIPEAFLNLSTLLTLDLSDNNLSGSIPEAVVALPSLRVLLLGGNQLKGFIPKWFCQLNSISIMDLSGNFFSGSIPHCFYNLSFGAQEIEDTFKVQFSFTAGGDPVYTGLSTGLANVNNFFYLNVFFEEQIEFATKHRADTYKGNILNYMSGLDLSRNNFTGEIGDDIVKLSNIHALNLSWNHLTGSIPVTLAKLSQLESLDLSHNKLNQEIPSELISLHFLSVFSVAYNDLSGRIPDMKGQFSTFDKSSYEGNPLLCGVQLEKRCSGDPDESPVTYDQTNEKWYEIDVLVFFVSFSVSFLLFFLGVIGILYVNPYWRRKLFYYSEEFMLSCYYFLYDHSFMYFIRLYH
ncbi:receptor like protein 14 [Euphorbia peplus]|nr:receptor like protein 14 [Euphorbia peplus]